MHHLRKHANHCIIHSEEPPDVTHKDMEAPELSKNHLMWRLDEFTPIQDCAKLAKETLVQTAMGKIPQKLQSLGFWSPTGYAGC